MKSQKIIIIGKSGSGKDTMKKLLVESGLKEAVFHTTRKIRKNEQDGIDYHFINDEVYKDLLKRNFFLQSKAFGEDLHLQSKTFRKQWYYGLSYNEAESATLFVANIFSAEKIIERFGRENCFIIELFCPILERCKRLVERGDDLAEIERRICTDYLDFSSKKSFIPDIYFDTSQPGSKEKFIQIIEFETYF